MEIMTNNAEVISRVITNNKNLKLPQQYFTRMLLFTPFKLLHINYFRAINLYQVVTYSTATTLY